MDEKELAEIESRILDYPVEARRDILRLTSELRSVKFSDIPQASARNSPLYDAATGLLNGGAYGVRFAGAMARATRYQKRFAVMSIDLARAWENADPGETERALKLIAQRLEQCVRAADTLARTDEQKFAIILEDLPQDGQMHHVTEKVQRALSEPLTFGERKLYPNATISIRVYPTPENTALLSPLDSRRP